MQKTTLFGNIGRDAIVNDAGGKTVLSFSVAVSKKWLDKDQVRHEKTTWFDCSYWGNYSALAPYLKTGQTVAIIGEIDLRTWQSKGGEFKAGLTMDVQELYLIGGTKERG